MTSDSFKSLFGQVVRFGAVGGVATVVNYGIFFTLFSWLHIHYFAASALGFLSGVSVGYPLNRMWTFRDQQRGTFTKYLLIYSISLATSLGLLWILSTPFGLDPVWGNLICIAYTTCTNFVGSRWLVFRVHTR